MADKLKIILIPALLIFLGARTILTGEIPAWHKSPPGVASFPITEPYVPWVGWIFILAGVYLFLRALYYERKR